MRITKTGFNGGRIAPTMLWSPDLPIHNRACKSMFNWLPKVNGSTTRRYGTKKLFELSADYDFNIVDDNVKRITFQYGEDSFDTVYVYTDTTFVPSLPEEGGDNRPTRIAIFNSEGKLVKEFDETESPWTTGEISRLFVLQSFDAIYVFSGGAPTVKITRESELIWSLTDHPFNGGPWKLGNNDRSHIVQMSLPEWDIATPYVTGNVVVTNVTTLGLTGVAVNSYRSSTVIGGRGNQRTFTNYDTRVQTTLSPAGIEAGDLVQIEGSVPGGNGDLDGEWRVARVDVASSYVWLATGTSYDPGAAASPSKWTNNYANADLTSASIVGAGQRQTFYECKQDHTGQNPTVQPSIYWVEQERFSGAVTLKATSDLWVADDAGRAFRMATNEAPRIFGNFDATSEGSISAEIPVTGLVVLTTEGGIWDGELALQLSLDQGATWQDIGTISSKDGSYNGSITRTISDFGALVRVYMRERNSAPSDSGCKYTLSVNDTQYHYFTIQTVVSATEVFASPQSPIMTMPSTWRWNLGAFSDGEGYPSAAAIIDNTMIVSGVAGSPGTIWLSSVGDWSNWVTGSYAGAAFDISIGKDTRNVVQWIQAKESLLIGTDAGEWSISPRDQDLTLSLSNYKLERQAEYGSSAVPALVVGGTIIYVEVDSFRIRALERSIYDRGTFDPSDISIQVPDWFESSNVKELAYARSPLPIVWVLMEDGSLYSWTFDPGGEVSAWAEHTIYGVDHIFSIGVTPSGSGDSLLLAASVGGQVVDLAASFNNDYLDHYREISTPQEGVLYYVTGKDDSIKAYDSAYISQELVYMNSEGGSAPSAKIIQLSVDPTLIQVLLDGTPLVKDRDWFFLGNGNARFLLVPYTSGTLTVTDGGSPATVTIHDAQDCTYITLTDDSPGVVLTLDNFDIEDGVGLLDPAADYLVFKDKNLAIVPDKIPTELTLTQSGGGHDPLVLGYGYTAVLAYQTIFFPNEVRFGTTIVGYDIDNLLHPTDLIANFQLGGPGGTVRFSKVDLLVEQSLGLQVRGYSGWEDPDEEEPWISVPDLTPTSVGGEALTPYTGVQRVDFSSDTQYNGVDIQIRANTPRGSTIGAMAVDVERVK